jgi:regulator of protease activity HflC (stomatin/prohibitin superfamily)
MFDRLIDFLLESLKMFQFWVVLDPYERGVLLRLGRFTRVLDPGLHFLWPMFVDRVIAENVVPRTHRITGLATTTNDGKAVGFDAVITYRISDVLKAVLEAERVEDAIADSCAGIICTHLSGLSWDAIVHQGAPESLTAACRKRGWKWGVEIQSVQLVGTALVRSIRLMTSTEHTMAIS